MPEGKFWNSLQAPCRASVEMFEFECLGANPVRIRSVKIAFKGLQAVVEQSEIGPSGPRALQSQKWLRKTRQKVESSCPLIERVIEPVGQIVETAAVACSPSYIYKVSSIESRIYSVDWTP